MRCSVRKLITKITLDIVNPTSIIMIITDKNKLMKVQ